MPKVSGNSTFPKDEDDALGWNRETLGRRVREVWVAWAKTQHEPKASWLLPWEELDERDREVDRQIGETIAMETGRRLAKENDDLLMDLARLRDLRSREAAAFATMRHRAERAERTRGLTFVSFGLSIALVFLLGWVYWHIPEPVVCPPPPDPILCPPAVVCEPTSETPHARYEDQGFWTGDSDGMSSRRDWPDATGYPAERFETDCHDVCAVPDGYGHEAHSGRVLVMDPSRLVCVCFHPDSHGSAWAVTRWIGWERIR